MTTYREAGVDVIKNTRLIQKIKLTTNINTSEFAKILTLPGINVPQLVMSTDGVGTKIRLAAKWDMSGISQDLVAMCANDIIAAGGRPRYFQDYIGMNSLDEEMVTDIICQLNQVCNEHGIELTGGELAEMPRTYIDNIPELVGFCVGTTTNPIKVKNVKTGDTIIGIASSGPHANGFSLINNISEASLRVIGIEKLLKPTIIYSNIIDIHEQHPDYIKSMAHITGGGLLDNLYRAIPSGYTLEIDYNSWHVPVIFNNIQMFGHVPEEDMWSTFNMGIGFCIITSNPDLITNLIENSWILGKII